MEALDGKERSRSASATQIKVLFFFPQENLDRLLISSTYLITISGGWVDSENGIEDCRQNGGLVRDCH